MKILWLTIYRGNRVARHFDTLRNAVSKIAKVDHMVRNINMIAGPYSKATVSGQIKQKPILHNLLEKENYDFIMCDALFAYLSEDWKNIKIPKAALLEDMHGPIVKYQADYIADRNFDIVFHRYNAPMKEYHPTLFMVSKCIWLPHAVDKIFHYYGEKTIDVLFTGCIGQTYPTRRTVVERLKDKPYFKRWKRPPESLEKKEKYPIGEGYAKLISSAKIHPTCGSKLYYPVMKFMEIPACRTLLMSDWFSELRYLGFQPGRNMVTLDMQGLDRQMKWWIKHDKKREEVAKAGEELIKQKHTVEIRAKEFLEHIRKL